MRMDLAKQRPVGSDVRRQVRSSEQVEQLSLRQAGLGSAWVRVCLLLPCSHQSSGLLYHACQWGGACSGDSRKKRPMRARVRCEYGTRGCGRGLSLGFAVGTRFCTLKDVDRSCQMLPVRRRRQNATLCLSRRARPQRPPSCSSDACCQSATLSASPCSRCRRPDVDIPGAARTPSAASASLRPRLISSTPPSRDRAGARKQHRPPGRPSHAVRCAASQSALHAVNSLFRRTADDNICQDQGGRGPIWSCESSIPSTAHALPSKGLRASLLAACASTRRRRGLCGTA
ncbi:hypothetical protein B0J12DRAFT_333038 [Macrophomina phaseolina]|uniref:Uncharacterized protein n=1 Tax=Macrophomina phaseolina TaxID=35725 RepID=A0ABQ8GNW9_9PEZI|nr:hypothetical protein B0J12DRAFT_333038 [Macrophomina phaseolina]